MQAIKYASGGGGGSTPALKPRAEVQNRDISSPTKRTDVLQN